MNFGKLYDEIRENFIKLIKSPDFYIYIFLIILFSYLSYYTYYKYYVKPKTDNYKPNKEYIKDETKEVSLYYFYTTWCPYSKSGMEVMKKFQEEHKTYKNYNINYYYVDAEEQEDLANDYNVENYPSLFLVKGDDKIYFDANVKEQLLTHFLNSSL